MVNSEIGYYRENLSYMCPKSSVRVIYSKTYCKLHENQNCMGLIAKLHCMMNVLYIIDVSSLLMCCSCIEIAFKYRLLL